MSQSRGGPEGSPVAEIDGFSTLLITAITRCKRPLLVPRFEKKRSRGYGEHDKDNFVWLRLAPLPYLLALPPHSRQQRYASQSGEAQSMKHSNSATARPTDKEFARKAAEGGLAQVKVGQLAEEKGQSQTVKDFGKRMVDDHSKAARRTEAGSSKFEYHAAGSARCQRSGDL